MIFFFSAPFFATLLRSISLVWHGAAVSSGSILAICKVRGGRKTEGRQESRGQGQHTGLWIPIEKGQEREKEFFFSSSLVCGCEMVAAM